MCKKTPHKHAEVIKAWADGAEIEFKDHLTGTWYAVGPNPFWCGLVEYRVKPAPIFFRAYQSHAFSSLSIIRYNEGDKAPVGYEWVSEPFELKLPS